MKRFSALAAALLAIGSSHAALQPGEIAFTAFNADEDGFAVVALRDIAPFSAIYFTDNEWSGGAPGGGGFNTGEGTYAWVTGASVIAAGGVVRFSDIDGAARAASIGAFGQVLSGLAGFAATGDTLFAYSGDSAAQPTALLAAISTDNFSGSSLADSGLSLGVNALSVQSGADFAEYSGVRSGLAGFGAYAARIADSNQWVSHASGDFAAAAPNLTPFAVTAVPEPQTYALLATGLGLIGLRLHRRRQRHALLPLAY
ncbi:MAG: PEP-CTERM sorting domain-containing protein [Betaproteobacteria bacterium]|nr:PEP-CTERM sorting domain-containing protein [Betaproteobacteria bacterium]